MWYVYVYRAIYKRTAFYVSFRISYTDLHAKSNRFQKLTQVKYESNF